MASRLVSWHAIPIKHPTNEGGTTVTTQVAADKPEEFRAGGGSPPPSTHPPQLAEELARIIARALVADYYAGLAKTSTNPSSTSSRRPE